MDMSSVNAEEIRSYRERWMMTHEELAEKVGVPVGVVVEWETGVRPVPTARMGSVRKALGMDELKSEFGQEALLRQLGRLAKQRREELGMGRIPFSKEIGLGSDKTLVDFEFGRRMPSGSTQRKVEKGLGWRIGVIDDVMRMLDRKASNIAMEELDAEDSLHIAAQSGVRPLALVSNEALLEELARRLEKAPAPMQNREAQNLFDLAASTNVEHLEDED